MPSALYVTSLSVSAAAAAAGLHVLHAVCGPMASRRRKQYTIETDTLRIADGVDSSSQPQSPDGATICSTGDDWRLALMCRGTRRAPNICVLAKIALFIFGVGPESRILDRCATHM